MTIGESSERAQSVGQTCGQAGSSAPSGVKTAAQRSATSPIRRVFSTFLAVTLAVSMTPSAALAETQDAAVSSAQEQSQELDGALAQGRNAESPESVASSAPGQTASGSPDAATSDSEQAASAQPETPAASAKPEAAQASVSADENLADTLSDGDGAAAQADATLSSSAKVYIQDAKDKDSSYSTKSGSLSAGDTLWANVYDEEDWEEYSVSNPGTWTYAWMAGTKNSASISDYTELVGQSQSLTVTSEMAGKYFICKVTADGKDYYGPAKSYGSGVNANEIPGPVLSAGQAQLYKVTLSSSAPAVGDTLAATAFTSYSTQVTDDIDVSYTWSYSDSKYGTFAVIEGQTASTLALTPEYQGKYIKVTASAGVNEQSATTSEAVMSAGAVKLAGVELKASSTEIGATLTAKAYTGSSYSPTYVDDSKVTYTWKKYKGTSAPSYSATWETIEGQNSNTLSVDDGLEGCYVTVSANAGANDVAYGGYSTSYVGPFKQAGAVDIYSALLAPAGSESGSYVYCVGDTVRALAKEKGASSFIEASKLNYQWQQSDSKNGSYTDIPGETQETLALTDALQGKYIKCVVSSKIGSSKYTTRATSVIAAAGSINVTKVQFEGSTGKINVGDTLTATAMVSSDDVSDNPGVAWSWYYGDSSNSCTTKIEGVQSNTFTVTDSYLGKYIQARADGGFGEAKATRGPVVEAGAVTLHHVEVTGSAKVGAVLTAAAYTSSYSKVSPTDKVHYRWQYADSKTTSDSDFKDIQDAADQPTYTVSDAMVGKFIRVKAISDGAVVSTQKPSSYGSGTTSVNPIGPVTIAGQYTLSSVEIKDVSTAILQVGRTVTPQAKVSSGYYNENAPDDAKLTYAWYAKGEEDADWQQVTGGVSSDGTLTIGASLAGKSLKVTAYSLDNTVEWVSGTTVAAAGEYDLLRVITTPQAISSTTHLVTGDAVTAEAQSKRADSNTINGVKVEDGVAFSWFAADTADGQFTQLEGVEGANITVPAAAAGKYLKVVATSGSSHVETVFANKVLDRDSVDAVVQKLSDKNVKPAPVYGNDTNLNSVLEAKIAELGFQGVTAKVDSVQFVSTSDKAMVGVSAADDDTNGDITFFDMDPNEYSGYNFNGLRTATVSFTLSKDGETAAYAPGSILIPWNEDMLQQRLDNVAQQLTIGYSNGDNADAVTGKVTLLYRAGSANKYEVAWESSSDQVKISGYGWSDYAGAVTRTASDRQVTLTAAVKLLSNAGGDSTSVTGAHAFDITVKGDPDKVAAEKAALQKKVDAGFTYDNVKYSGGNSVADKDGLSDDLQMPTTRALGVDGKYYKIEYSASTDHVSFNGYKGTVYQPQPGESAAATSITLTVTDKSNPEITASKTLDYQVKPLDQENVDAELALMEQAKAGYAAAILNGQDAKAVTDNLHAFQKAYLDADGNLAWSYDRSTTDATALGIVPVDLPGYDSMGTQGWRTFKSSNQAVVSHENLQVTQPEYNTKITITSNLSSQKYARYAERFPDNQTYAKLANQEVTATITVIGTSGIVNPQVSATCSVIGVDAQGNQQTWAAAQNLTLANGATAADLSEELFRQTGLKADYNPNGSWGWALNTIVSPFDKSLTLGYDQKTGKYWQLFINGKASSVGAGGYVLEEGDSVQWAYSAYGESAPTDALSVSCEVVGQDADGNQQIWAQPTTIDMSDGSTAADLTRALFKQVGLTADIQDSAYGFYLSTITSPFDKNVTLGWDQNTNKYWQLFINGEYANFGADSCILHAGDKVSWVYGADGTMPGQMNVTVEVIGQDGNGKAERWAQRSRSELATATFDDICLSFFDECGLVCDIRHLGSTWLLASITSPSGVKLQGGWNCLINGKAINSSNGLTFKSGDTISWVHGTNTLPNLDEVTVDPSAPRPDWKADWAGDQSRPTMTATPTDYMKSEWTLDYKQFSSAQYANASEPVIVNGFVYLAVGNRLLKIDSSTGEVLAQANLVSSIGYTTRPVYAQGVIMVPLDGGAVQALTADNLTTVWVTDKLSDLAQSNSAITVNGNYAYVGTCDVDFEAGTFDNGFLTCINILTGAVVWQHNNAGEGYYWGGAVNVNGYTVVATSAGTVEVLSGAGSVVSTVSLGALVNSSCVASADGKTLYVMSRDGKLHVLAIDEQGSLKEIKVVDLGLSGCASMPTVNGSTMYVGGEVESGAAALAIVDLDSLASTLITQADGAPLPWTKGLGGIKAAPLVSTQNGETYVYFTVNSGETSDWVNYTSGGGVYRYKVGDAQATLVYDAKGFNNCCDSPVICDAEGNLYYINDSGTLFKLVGGGVKPSPSPVPDPAPVPGPAPQPNPNPAPVPGSDLGTQPTVAGAVAPASLPVAAGGAAQQTDSVSASASARLETSSSASASGAAEQHAATATSSDSSDAAESDNGSRGPIWPYVVLGLGVAGILGAGVWWLLAKRRLNGVR